MLSFVLPLTQCQQSTRVPDANKGVVEVTHETEAIYPIGAIDGNELDKNLVLIAIYFWPLVALLLRLKIAPIWPLRILTSVELGASLYTAYFVLLWSSLGTAHFVQ